MKLITVNQFISKVDKIKLPSLLLPSLVHNKSIKQTYIYVLWSLHCLAKSKERHGSNLISSRQSSSERIQSVGNYTAQQDFRWVPRVYMYNNTIGSVVMLVMCMIWEVNYIHNWNWNQQSYWLEQAFKETCVNIPAVPLEFRLDPSI